MCEQVLANCLYLTPVFITKALQSLIASSADLTGFLSKPSQRDLGDLATDNRGT